MVCQTCLNAIQNLQGAGAITAAAFNEQRFLPHHMNGTRLKDASHAGCYFCHGFWSIFTVTEQTQLLLLDHGDLSPHTVPVPKFSWGKECPCAVDYATECVLEWMPGSGDSEGFYSEDESGGTSPTTSDAPSLEVGVSREMLSSHGDSPEDGSPQGSSSIDGRQAETEVAESPSLRWIFTIELTPRRSKVMGAVGARRRGILRRFWLVPANEDPFAALPIYRKHTVEEVSPGGNTDPPTKRRRIGNEPGHRAGSHPPQGGSKVPGDVSTDIGGITEGAKGDEPRPESTQLNVMAKEDKRSISSQAAQRGAEASDTEKRSIGLVTSSSTASAESWKVAEGWLATCARFHTCIERLGTPTWLPTRLLAVREAEDSVCLVDIVESTHRETTRYVTLSHRWGSERPMTLTKSTEAELRRGVHVQNLPEAFQDAITICKRLCVCYIWIDSLCIMQDDVDDWLRESSRMHGVYSHSFLNISALAAANSAHPFLVHRLPDTVNNPRIFTRKLGQACTTYVGMRQNFWEDQVASEHLNRRGWVLQERLLAPRVLHFGRYQLLWECNGLKAAESYPLGLPPFAQVDDPDELLKLKPDVSSSQAEQYDCWNRIVTVYTACELTNSGDKLIALAGIANHMAAILKDRYVVGMWYGHLVHDLCWRAVQPACTSDAYRAPSFSWASVDGQVTYNYAHIPNPLAQVLDVALDHANNDVTGLARGGSVILRSSLRKFDLETDPKTGELFVTSIDSIEIIRFELDIFLDDDGPLSNAEAHHGLYGLLMKVERLRSVVGYELTLVYIVLRLVNAETTTYRRVGLAVWQTDERDVTGRKGGKHGSTARMIEGADSPAMMYGGEVHTVVVL